MGGHQYGLAALLFLQDQVDEAVLHQRVQSAGGFIEDEHRRVMHQRAYNGHLLLHSLGHAPYPARGVQLKALAKLSGAARAPHAAVGGQKADELAAAHIVGQGGLARNIAHIFLNGRSLCAAVKAVDRAGAGIRRKEPHQLADGGGFSCAVWAKKAEHLSLLHGERNVEHAVPAAVILCDVRKRDHAHKYSSL